MVFVGIHYRHLTIHDERSEFASSYILNLCRPFPSLRTAPSTGKRSIRSDPYPIPDTSRGTGVPPFQIGMQSHELRPLSADDDVYKFPNGALCHVSHPGPLTTLVDFLDFFDRGRSQTRLTVVLTRPTAGHSLSRSFSWLSGPQCLSLPLLSRWAKPFSRSSRQPWRIGKRTLALLLRGRHMSYHPRSLRVWSMYLSPQSETPSSCD